MSIKALRPGQRQGCIESLPAQDLHSRAVGLRYRDNEGPCKFEFLSFKGRKIHKPNPDYGKVVIVMSSWVYIKSYEVIGAVSTVGFPSRWYPSRAYLGASILGVWGWGVGLNPVHLAAGSLSLSRCTGHPLLVCPDIRRGEEVLELIEGSGRHVRAHNGQCFFYSEHGHWNVYKGVVPQGTLARCMKFLLQLEGLYAVRIVRSQRPGRR